MTDSCLCASPRGVLLLLMDDLRRDRLMNAFWPELIESFNFYMQSLLTREGER